MSATKPHIPNTTGEISADWLTEVFATAAVDGTIRKLVISPVGTGQMATSVRAEMSYESSGPNAPDSVVIKLASDDPNSRAAGARGAYLREVRYYQLLDASVDVSTPNCFWSDIDIETNAFALVLEDMRPAEQGDQILGCATEQAMQAAINIAGLHAPRWCDAELFKYEWLTPPPDQRATSTQELHTVTGALTEGFIDRYGAAVTDRVAELLRRFARNLPEWLELGNDQFALTHADHRLDNLLFSPFPERPVTVVDWQTVGVRNPLADVAYLLGTGLSPELRRTAEQDIVGAYHQSLVDRGVTSYSPERCFLDYRQQTLHALLITVLGSMMTVRTDRGDNMFMAMLHRCTEQIFDLDADQFC